MEWFASVAPGVAIGACSVHVATAPPAAGGAGGGGGGEEGEEPLMGADEVSEVGPRKVSSEYGPVYVHLRIGLPAAGGGGGGGGAVGGGPIGALLLRGRR